MRSMVEGEVRSDMRAPRQTIVRARTLRRTMTLPEVVLWGQLRRGGMDGMRFRRQHPVGPFVLDFYCSAARLAVEVDGAAHDRPEQAAADRARTTWLGEQGIAVLRLRATDVLRGDGAEHVLPAIAAACAGRLEHAPDEDAPSTASGGPPPPLRG